MATSQAKSGGTRKYGRAKKKCERYFNSQRRYKNKVRKARKRYGGLPQEKLDKILSAIRF